MCIPKHQFSSTVTAYTVQHLEGHKVSGIFCNFKLERSAGSHMVKRWSLLLIEETQVIYESQVTTTQLISRWVDHKD
jgi:hypothetical protein